MRFEWDEAKRVANLERHCIDFIDAQALFEDEHVLTYASRRGGEDRWVSIGAVSGRLIALVGTVRADAYRLISARRARDEEANRHRELFG